jgi:hypothetical protein
MPVTRLASSAAAVTAAALLLASCGSDPAGPAAGDDARAYAFNAIKNAQSVGTGFGPQTLADALPNQPHRLPDGTIITFSDALVFGRVVDVEKGEARVHTGDDEYKVTEFDDPAADERSVNVSVKVEETLAGEATGPVLVFRMGLMGASDAETYIDGLRSLGDVVVAVKAVEDGADRGVLYPILSGASIGQVDSSGNLSYVGMEDQKAFLQGLDTLTELRMAARMKHDATPFPPVSSDGGTDLPAPE